ncbi:hypothetical protein IE53DRAFT_182124 [Violaceomyces palustris]|uniref:Uncharacterized protein n=1 Tax=Violaceomyces palustris TaxID=1673888 RepID=A0ACD0NSC8_9BASI|nr:hypothetical protein IE53DRAFT_182124 [Violaceomyces palustris]
MSETATAKRPPAHSGRRSPPRANAKHHLEPNPFEQSFSSGPSELAQDRKTDLKNAHTRQGSLATPPLSTRPGAAYRDRQPSKNQSSPNGDPTSSTPKPLLPPVASITSPANETSQYPWGSSLSSSLRSGPLSPAMLAGPQNPHFDPSTFRTGFTPDLSNFKTGLTPLGGGAISFPPPSPNTAAFLAMVTNSSAPGTSGATITPNTLSALTGAVSSHVDGPGASLSTQPQGFSRPLDSHDQFDLAFSRTFHNNDRPQHAGSKLRTALGDASSESVSSSVSPHMVQRPLNGAGLGPANHQQQQEQQQQQQQPQQQQQQQASQAASGLFLLSQAHQEISKREGEGSTLKSSQNQSNSDHQQGKTKGAKAAKHAGAGAKRKKPRVKKAQSEASSGAGMDDHDENGSDDGGDEGDGNDDGNGRGDDGDENQNDEKRKNFLERNRQAALKCRQRKKAWLASLQAKVEYLQNDNENLQNTVGALRNEIMFLKNQLVQAHGGAPPQPMGMGMGMGIPGMPHGHHPHEHEAHMVPPGVGIPPGMPPHYAHGPVGPHPHVTQGPPQPGAGAYSAHAVPRPSHLPNSYGPESRSRARSEAGGPRNSVDQAMDVKVNGHGRSQPQEEQPPRAMDTGKQPKENILPATARA